MSHQNTGQEKLLNSATDWFELTEMPFYFSNHSKSYCIFDQDLHLKSFMFPVGYCHSPETIFNLEKIKSKKGKFLFQDNIWVAAKDHPRAYSETWIYISVHWWYIDVFIFFYSYLILFNITCWGKWHSNYNSRKKNQGKISHPCLQVFFLLIIWINICL